MAESWTLAFGRYLRNLRERRGLSLDEVQELSRAFPDPIQKGYLSKCENGRQGLAMSKLVPLCRIYDVPAEVLVERLQLDMELEKEDAPDTEGMTFAELTERGIANIRDGFIWRGYAYLRDSLRLADSATIQDKYASQDEQAHVAHVRSASAALKLGAPQFALHECQHAVDSSALTPRFRAIALEKVAGCYRRLGRFQESKQSIEEAIDIARASEDEFALGYCLSGRAVLATFQEEFEIATRFDEEAYRCFRNQDLRHDCARTLANLAQCYVFLNRLRAARRAINESLRITEELGLERQRTLAHILLGDIELAESRPEKAGHHLRKAAQIADGTGDKVLWFKAQFHLLRYARQAGSTSEVRRLHDQLSRLKARIPPDTPELLEFNSLPL